MRQADGPLLVIMSTYFLLCILCGLLERVIASNQAPVFTSPTLAISVVENESGQVLLYTLTVSDADNDPLTCSIQSTIPNTFDFGVWKNSSDYGLYLVAGSILNFDVNPVYKVTLECSDGTASTAMNVTVHVTPNVPPTFTNLPATSGNANANSVQLGDVVYTVTANDVDSTSLTFSMTSFPASPPLFEIDAVSGKVRATQDLSYALNSAYDLTITVSDFRDTTTSNLIVPITNVNSAPLINNLPDTVHVDEDIGGNTALFTLSVSEPDSGDSAVITYVVSPAIYTSRFTLNGLQVRASGNRFDYEEQNTFTLTFTVSDGKVSTSESDYVLTVNINDVNERCAFQFSSYYATLQEENNTDTADPGFTVTDDDTDSTFIYDLQNTVNATYFTINPISGVIGFAVNYDVDIVHPHTTAFRVHCIDNYDWTGTTTLYVTVEDINDNAPRFSATGYVIYFDQTMGVPYNVETLSAADADSGDNAVLDYSWSTSGTGSTYFSLLPSGIIVLHTDPEPSLSYGDNFRFVVTVKDNGSPVLSGTTTVDLIYQEANLTTIATTMMTATTTVPPTQPPNDKTFWNEPGNIVVLVIAGLLGIPLCGFTTYLIRRYIWNRGSVQKKPKKIQPKPKFEKTPFDFWKADELQNRPSTISKRNGTVQQISKTQGSKGT